MGNTPINTRPDIDLDLNLDFRHFFRHKLVCPYTLGPTFGQLLFFAKICEWTVGLKLFKPSNGD